MVKFPTSRMTLSYGWTVYQLHVTRLRYTVKCVSGDDRLVKNRRLTLKCIRLKSFVPEVDKIIFNWKLSLKFVLYVGRRSDRSEQARIQDFSMREGGD